MTSDPYFDLPEDPELAFLQIERELRATLDERLNSADNNSPWGEWYQDYANHVIGAAEGLDIAGFNHLALPSNENYHEEYRKIVLAVDRFAVQVRIKHSRRMKKYSVALDSATKSKIRHHLTQLKEMTDKLEISIRKREAIISKIIALEEELEKPRTSFEVVGAFIVDAASIGGEAGERLEPWRKWLEPIARLVGLAKDKEASNPTLPPSSPVRKIEPPKKPESPSTSADFDDDIPF